MENQLPFSEENKPYEPKSHLKISLNGVKEGDFAMIMGYPGSTQRYLSSWGVKNTMEFSNDYRAKIRGYETRYLDKITWIRVTKFVSNTHQNSLVLQTIGNIQLDKTKG
jgi:hypothetical protein